MNKKIKFEIKSYVDRILDLGSHFQKGDERPKRMTVKKLFKRVEELCNLKFVKAEKLNKWYETSEVSSAELFYALSASLVIAMTVRKENKSFDKASDFITEQIIEANTTKNIEDAKTAIKNVFELMISILSLYAEIYSNLIVFKILFKKYHEKIRENEEYDYRLLALVSGFDESKIEDPKAIKEITAKISEKFKNIKTYDELIENLDNIKVNLYMDKVSTEMVIDGDTRTATECRLNAERMIEVFKNKEAKL